MKVRVHVTLKKGVLDPQAVTRVLDDPIHQAEPGF